MKKMGIIIFDIDGTLFDSMELYTSTFSDILSEVYNVPIEASIEVFNSTSGLPLDQQFMLALKNYRDLDYSDVLNLVQTFWDFVEGVEVPLIENAIPVIHQLSRAGYKLVASSGSLPSVINKRLIDAGLFNSFQLILGTEFNGIGLVKGESHFNEIKRKLLLPNQILSTSAIMIGDGAHDSKLAEQFGLLFVAYLGGRKTAVGKIKAEVYIQNLIELITLLSSNKTDSKKYLPIYEFIRISRKDDLWNF